MKYKIESRMPVEVSRRSHRITHAAGGFVTLQNLVPFERHETAFHIVLRSGDSFSDFRERRGRLLFARCVDNRARDQFFVRRQDERFPSPLPDHQVQFWMLLDVLA